MNVQFYSIDGAKKATRDIPANLIAERVNKGLIHQAVVLQQSNRRQSPAHAKSRGEVVGSTKKMYQQKHTGKARRGPIRSPTLRGGGKAFGPKKDKNYTKLMPREMRHGALRACITWQAQQGAIIGLESFPDTVKTKTMATFLGKVPVARGRRILIVTPGGNKALHLSARNIDRVTTVDAAYLNPEDLMLARSIVIVGDALEKAADIFGVKDGKTDPRVSKIPTVTMQMKKKAKKADAAATKPAKAKKKSTPSA